MLKLNNLKREWPLVLILAVFLALVSNKILKSEPNFDDSKILNLTKIEIDNLSYGHDLYEVFPEKYNQIEGSWYREENKKIVLFRPLASLLHIFEMKIGMYGFQGMLLINILLYLALMFAYAAFLKRLFNFPEVVVLGMLIYFLDFKNIEAVGWLSSRCIVLAGLFSILSLNSVLKYNVTQNSKDYFATLVFFVCAVLCYEPAIACVFYITPLLIFGPARQIKRNLGIWFCLIGFYTGFILWNGIGASSVAYVDPISNFKLYVNRVFYFYPDYFIKKFDWNSDHNLYPYSPPWFFWTVFLSFYLVYFLKFSKRQTLQARIIVWSTVLHPLVLCMSVVTSRGLYIYSLFANVLLLSFLDPLKTNHFKKWIYLSIGVVLLYSSYKSVIYYEENQFYINNVACSKNIQEFNTLISSTDRKFVFVNEPPLIFYRLADFSKLGGRFVNPLTDNAENEFTIAKKSQESFIVSSIHPRGLTKNLANEIFQQTYTVGQIFALPSVTVTIDSLNAFQLPSKISITPNFTLTDYHFLVWKEDCRFKEISL